MRFFGTLKTAWAICPGLFCFSLVRNDTFRARGFFTATALHFYAPLFTFLVQLECNIEFRQFARSTSFVLFGSFAVFLTELLFNRQTMIRFSCSFISALFIMALVVSSTTAVPAAELDAMRDLQASIDPINRLNWFSTPDACTGSLNQWVSVISTNDSITGIALPYYGMEGTLPNSIGNLRNLTRLSISGNRLSGTLPQSLLQTQLSELRMDGNSFSSPLPTTFSECQR
jgi:hypothetical protein